LCRYYGERDTLKEKRICGKHLVNLYYVCIVLTNRQLNGWQQNVSKLKKVREVITSLGIILLNGIQGGVLIIYSIGAIALKEIAHEYWRDLYSEMKRRGNK